MTYAMRGLGQASVNGPNQPIRIGATARRDPILAFSTVWASEVVRMATLKRRASRRLAWIRGELNKMQVGLGDEFVSEYRRLQRMGRSKDQALFDALRLVLANQVATGMDKMATTHSAAGLGDSSRDINAVFCGVIGVGTAGGAIAASFENPAGSAAIGQAGSAALSAAGCNQGALEAQARIAEANAMAAQANAAASASVGQQEQDRTMTYVAIGGGVLVLGLVAVLALRK